MESNATELVDKGLKDEYIIGNVGNVGDMEQTEMKKKKIKRILIIISVILLIIIIALILYFLLIPKDKCKKGENDNCLSCEKGSQKCSSCNPNFRLEN